MLSQNKTELLGYKNKRKRGGNDIDDNDASKNTQINPLELRVHGRTRSSLDNI